MFKLNYIKKELRIASAVLLSTVTLNGYTATATFDPASGIVDLPSVEVLSGGSSAFYNARLQLSGNELQLIAAGPISATTGQRNVYDSDKSAVHVPSVVVGADDFYVKFGSNPLRFTVDQLAN